jgi:hypothetical protein
MAVAVELETERRPGGDAQVAEAELRVDEVEVVVEVLPFAANQVAALSLGVVAAFELGTGLDRGEHVDQAWMRAPRRQDCLDPRLLPKAARRADILDLYAMFGGQALGIGPHLVTPHLCVLGIVLDSDVVGVKVGLHALAVADAR